MEESRLEWMDRIQWYERQYELNSNNRGEIVEDEDEDSEKRKGAMLQKRLDATVDQVHELERLLKETEERAARAEQKALDAEMKATAAAENTPSNQNDHVDEASKEMLRDQRIKIAETERANRELQRQNADWKNRCQEMVQHRERAASSQRHVQQLESELQNLLKQVEEGKEAQLRWTSFRNEIIQEGLVGDENADVAKGGSMQPPEIATVIRKFQTLKRKTQHFEEENSRIMQLSESHLRRCSVLETQLKEKTESTSSLEKELKGAKETISHLELENRKIVAQQKIWQRETEGMRSLLDTYEQQETKSPMKLGRSSGGESSPAVEGLQVSLKSAQDQVKLLSETNQKLESDLEVLRDELLAAKSEHERVLEKFHKLRNALIEERSKAEAAEARACQAETLAGKGSYNSETTRVIHLKSNPFAEAIKEKHQAEIEALNRRLEEAEEALAAAGDKRSSLATEATTPSASTGRGSIGSAGASGKKDDTLSSLDAQKLHKRLKERFKEQIGLFREGVYLITGYKIDMSFSDSDCPRFKVRSIYGETEDDHLMFQWPKQDSASSLDLLTTDMARLLMNGPSAIYMTKFNSVPAFIASVTLELFDKQTMI